MAVCYIVCEYVRVFSWHSLSAKVLPFRRRQAAGHQSMPTHTHNTHINKKRAANWHSSTAPVQSRPGQVTKQHGNDKEIHLKAAKLDWP